MPDRSAPSTVRTDEIRRYQTDPLFHAAVKLVASHLEVHTTTAIRTVVEVEGLLAGGPPVVNEPLHAEMLRAPVSTTTNVPPTIPERFDV